MEAGRRIPPTHFLKLSYGKLETCSLFLGLLLCIYFGDLSQALLIQSEKLRPPGGWSPHPFNIYLDPLPGPFDWAWHLRCAVCKQVLHGCRPSGWGGTRPGYGSIGSCGALLVILPLWHGHLWFYCRACGCMHRQTLSITSLIGSTFRLLEEASQDHW